MRIDVHAHLFSKAYIEALRHVFGNDNSPAGQDAQRLIKWMSTDPRMTHVEGRLQEMEKWGIGMQVLSVPFHGALVQDRAAAGARLCVRAKARQRSGLHVGNDIGCDSTRACRRLRAAPKAANDLSASRGLGALSHGTHSMGLRAVSGVQRKSQRAAGGLFQAL